MKQTFITVIPLQSDAKVDAGKTNFNPAHYGKTKNCSVVMAEGALTRFPIIPVIQQKWDRESERQIIAIMNEDNEAVKVNFAYFKEEVKKIDESLKITTITIPNNQDMKTNLKLYYNLYNAIEDDCEIYADVSFGSKVHELIINCVIKSLIDLKTNVDAFVFYGEITKRNTIIGEYSEGLLYDATPILEFARNSAWVKNMVTDPEILYKRLIEKEIEDE